MLQLFRIMKKCSNLNNSIFFIVVCCFLSGCQKKSIHKQHQEDYYEFQARCSEVPFPLDAQIKNKGIISHEEKDAQFFVVYATKQSLDQLNTLYHYEMEFLGWAKTTQFSNLDNETVFVFERPYKIAIIIISNQEKQRIVRCYLSSKSFS
jgi:hypothetical protein